MQQWKRIANGLVILTLCCAVGVTVAGCDGELPVPGQITATTGGPSSSTTEDQTVVLGRQVAATWQEAIQELIPLLEGTPPVSSIQTAVAGIKEQYVQRMVALGHRIYALAPAEQRSIYERADDILASTANKDWFLTFKTLYEQYSAGADETSQNFAVLLSTFVTLTQYAFFDVLNDQEPEEAQRLGVD